jgi:NADH:ubiquinone oxidoreductase subunit 5 (subunit L)/multisubunit Na+/H+ antiporter MnhA subunit
MSLIILIISLIIHLYSFNYLSKDEQVIRFIFYLSLFSIFMLILSTASNLITIFIGWEGVGILSYLLINF